MRYAFALAALPFALAAPFAERDAQASQTKYIVVLKSDAPVPAAHSGTLASTLGAAGSAVASVQKDYIYESGNFKGFSATLTGAQIAALKQDSTVAYIEVDAQVHINAESNADTFGQYITQYDAPWGLGRLAHRENNNTDYIYHKSAGAGTCSYIVDTGVYAEHPEFEGRAELIKSFVIDADTDDNGHGTHVSGTIGSKSYGVAKKTKLLGVKVLDSGGSGYWSDVIAGIGYAVNDTKTRGCPNGAVINMSLGGSRTQSINDAVAAAVDAGVFVAVAAGNDGLNCDAFSPSSEPKAFTVGAIDTIDNITYFSNYGALVDGFAPGLDINSTWIGGPDAWNVISGTSMATPHVAGLGAYLLGLFGKASPAELANKIKFLSTKNHVNNIFPNTGTPNFLAFNGRPGW